MIGAGLVNETWRDITRGLEGPRRMEWYFEPSIPGGWTLNGGNVATLRDFTERTGGLAQGTAAQQPPAKEADANFNGCATFTVGPSGGNAKYIPVSGAFSLSAPGTTNIYWRAIMRIATGDTGPREIMTMRTGLNFSIINYNVSTDIVLSADGTPHNQRTAGTGAVILVEGFFNNGAASFLRINNGTAATGSNGNNAPNTIQIGENTTSNGNYDIAAAAVWTGGQLPADVIQRMNRRDAMKFGQFAFAA